MTNTEFQSRLKTEIRSTLCKLAKFHVDSEWIHIDDVPFSLENPGDDPHFQQVVQSIAEQTIDHCIQLCEQSLAE